MISGVQVTVDDDILLAIADTARKSPRLMQTAYERNTRRLRARLLADLRDAPGPPDYPLEWKSRKQQRFVMRKLREEGNLPYVRTGTLSANWRVTLTPDTAGSIMEVSNDTPYARFVQGDDQQPFLLKWPSVGMVISDYRVEAEDVLIETWFTVSDPTAGV
jgi:hypothetical protein